MSSESLQQGTLPVPAQLLSTQDGDIAGAGNNDHFLEMVNTMERQQESILQQIYHVRDKLFSVQSHIKVISVSISMLQKQIVAKTLQNEVPQLDRVTSITFTGSNTEENALSLGKADQYRRIFISVEFVPAVAQ